MSRTQNRFGDRLLMALVFLFLYAPIIILIVFSFNAGTSSSVWKGFSLKWYESLLSNRLIINCVYTSLLVSLLSTIVASIAGTFAAIGLYAHGNEPSHHILYLYTMLGQPWKTADKVREVLTTLYHDRPDGLSGNEDVGQMSAWYVLSSLGMYEAEPAGGRYWFGSPLFDRAEVKVPGGVFTLTAENNSAANKYIQRVWLNGQPYTKPWIGHADVMKGGELRFEMGAEEKVWYCPDEPEAYADQRPAEEQRLFKSEAVEGEIARVCGLLTNERLRWMFANCFHNTLDTTVHYGEDEAGNRDTYVYTGDIPAMWLRDSGAQVWPYVQLCKEDPALQKMIAGVIRRQFKLINIDPYANAFNVGPTGDGEDVGYPGNDQSPWVFERKWEIDSHCYPLRLAHHFW